MDCNCNTSTGVCGSITRGYGQLDDNGYWEHECPHGNAYSEYKPEDYEKKAFITQEQAWKLNFLNVVKEHLAKSDSSGSPWGVSLYLLMTMAEKAGLEFTAEERKLFL